MMAYSLLMGSGIYRILNNVNGKYYIGSTGDFKRREQDHFRDLKKSRHHNSHLQAAFNKYGKETFKFEILEFVSEHVILHIEQKYLDANFGQENCCNQNDSATRPPKPWGNTHSKGKRNPGSAQASRDRLLKRVKDGNPICVSQRKASDVLKQN